jgi:hypothetical protein
MGANQSSTTQSLVESLNQNITNITNSQSQSSSAQQSNVNQLSVKMVGAKIKNCNFNFSQKIQANQNTKALSSFNSKQALETLLNNAIANTVSQNQKSVNDMFSTSFSNQDQNVNMTTRLQNIVQTNINQSNEQSIIAKLDNLNKNELDLSGMEMDCSKNPSAGIDASQQIFSEQIVDAMTGLVTEALMKNQQIASAVASSSQTQSAENKGLSSVISAATGPLIIIAVAFIAFMLLGGKGLVTGGFSTLSDPTKLIKIIIGIAIVILTIVLVMKFKKSSSEKQFVRLRRFWKNPDQYAF